MKKAILICIGLAVAISIGLIILNQNTPTGAVIQVQTLDFAANLQPQSALIFIAEEKAFFLEQGLIFKYHHLPTGKHSLDTLIGGGVDIATTADVPIALAGLANQQISVIATISYSTDNIQVIARKDSGISEPDDLVNKRVATAKGGGPLFFTHRFFKRHNIDLSDVKLIYLNPHDMVTALIKGDIDAFIVFEPYPYFAKRELENNIISFSPDDLYGETWNVVVMDDFEKKNHEVIIKFIKALIRAEEYLNENPEESLEIIARYTEVKKSAIKEVKKRQKYELIFNEMLPDYLYEEAQWAIKNDFTSSRTIPVYENLIKTKYLKKLDSKRVTI